MGMAIVLSLFWIATGAVSYQIGRLQMAAAWKRAELLRREMSKNGTRLKKVRIRRT